MAVGADISVGLEVGIWVERGAGASVGADTGTLCGLSAGDAGSKTPDPNTPRSTKAISATTRIVSVSLRLRRQPQIRRPPIRL